jgi:hypothetical protein
MSRRPWCKDKNNGTAAFSAEPELRTMRTPPWTHELVTRPAVKSPTYEVNSRFYKFRNSVRCASKTRCRGQHFSRHLPGQALESIRGGWDTKARDKPERSCHLSETGPAGPKVRRRYWTRGTRKTKGKEGFNDFSHLRSTRGTWDEMFISYMAQNPRCADRLYN